MTNPEEQRALTDLTQLLARDPASLSRDELLTGVRKAEHAFETAQQWSGRFIAELCRRGDSYSTVADDVPMAKSTARRRHRELNE